MCGLFRQKTLFIFNQLLTGESQPVERFENVQEDKNIALTDLENIALLGPMLLVSALGYCSSHWGKHLF